MPFSINSQKEDIVLYDPHSREISRVEVRDLPDNTTCGPDAQGKTVYFKQPTPGAANAETYTPAVRGDGVAAADAKVRLNEYATKGSVTLADEDGEFTAWVELYNYGVRSCPWPPSPCRTTRRKPINGHSPPSPSRRAAIR